MSCQKYRKICLALLVIWKIKMKTIMRYFYTLTGLLKIKICGKS